MASTPLPEDRHAIVLFLCRLLVARARSVFQLASFSVRLDESGTDGASPYTVIAGAVAVAQEWDKAEAAWHRLLTRSNVSAFHWKEFQDRVQDFQGWGELKRKRFQDAQEKIIKRNTLFRVSVGLDNAKHLEIKERMRGIKGFSPESNYSMCLRYLMFVTCEQLKKIDSDCRLTILVEDGPWVAGARQTYQRVAAMTGKWKPARHAHRLEGFESAPKGIWRSLEIADYIAGKEHARLLAGHRPKRGINTLSMLLSDQVLEKWYEGMIEEKQIRRDHGQRIARRGS